MTEQNARSEADHRLKVLAIVPARGGSKGLPGKNVKTIAGKPLLAWTIAQSKGARLLTRTIVSTDSETIAEIAREHGADIPFLRPAELAQDTSPTADAVIHALDCLQAEGERYDFVAILEPTSPLRQSSDIDRAVSLLADNPNCESLVSAGEIHTEHPLIAKRIVENRAIPYFDSNISIHQRQQADSSYFPYGVIYLSQVDAFRRNRSFYSASTLPMLIERWQNYEIDDEIDFMIVERLLERYGNRVTGKR
ncbi:MAG: hypothetical protein CBD18_05315 [Opitutales bacterium TMED158]|nr:MAG: hypothetical protein CBD18_05315 [Opitutales bacterium TMED158]